MLTRFASIVALVCTFICAQSHGEEWIHDGRASEQASALLHEMRSAEAYGLRATDYELELSKDEIAAVIEGRADLQARERFDGAFSRAATRFVRELQLGRIEPRTAGFNFATSAARFDARNAIQQLASSRDVVATLASFEPSPEPYRRLKIALAEYRALAAQPLLTDLPSLDARSLREGDAYAGAPQLRRLLTALGDLSAFESSTRDGLTLDSTLVEAIRAFQRRHGLAADGILGPRTFAALTTPLAQRVLQLELSMERWRWLAAIAHRPDIVVNIPQFMLFSLPAENDPSPSSLEMRVIVGETEPRARTPVFATSITQVVFQPYWDVPRGILTRELLPKIRQDDSFLIRHDMEIVHGEGDDARIVQRSEEALDALASGALRLRQRPGAKNALGPVKFVMRNPYNVYLHATPEQALFERAQRTLSHGCIRVSEPHALAKYVLRHAAGVWDDAAIDAALCRKDTLRVPLEQPVRVLVFYATATVTRSGEALFFDDVYGHDQKLRQLLAGREKRR